MVRKRKGARARGHAAAADRPRAPQRDLLSTIACGALALALLCVGLLVDTGADAPFDAPKRLISLFLIGVAAGALAFSPWRRPSLGRPSSPRRWALLLLAWALAWSLLSAFLSPRRATALDAMRTIVLFVLLLWIGASRVLDGRKKWLLAAFLGVLALNAVVSILQARGLYQPFALQTAAKSRESTGAYVGNVGYLAQALALGSVAALGLLLCGRRPFARVAAASVLLLFFGALLGNRTLTSFSALLAGAAILCFFLFGRRAILPAAAAVLLLAIVVTEYRPMRHRLRGAVRAARAGDWNRLFTYRVGAWKAAVGMTRERPLFGYGPGTFGAEYVPHRLAAEIASRRLYKNPMRTSSYAEAHCDYLQPFAEAGVPAGTALLGAVGFLFLGLARAARRRENAARTEAILLLGLLGAGAAAALTWFPMQRPISAIPLLIAGGRAWRIAGAEEERIERPEQTDHVPPPPGPSARRLAAGAATLLALGILLRPELSRYRAERALKVGTETLRYVVTRPTEVRDPPLVLDRIAALAAGAAPGLPGDSRPWILAGGARLVGGRPDLALENYRKALRLGERAETDLNLGRAYEALGDRPKAHACFLRAVWVSPALRWEVLPDIAASLREEVARLESDLKKGRLRAPPPLPD